MLLHLYLSVVMMYIHMLSIENIVSLQLQVYEADLLDGGSLREIALPGIEDPVSFAVDWIANRFYIADQATNKIEMVSLSGVHRKTVITYIAKPVAVAVDPNAG